MVVLLCSRPVAEKPDEESRLTNLAEAVTRRRLSLGLTQREAAARGKISETVWSEVERGKRATLAPSTAYKLEKALGWEEGTVAALLRGDEVQQDSRHTEERSERERLEELERRMTLVLNVLETIAVDLDERVRNLLFPEDGS